MTGELPTLAIARCTDSGDLIVEAIRRLLGNEYDNQPVIKAKQRSRNQFSGTLLSHPRYGHQ